jgi:hypothetical protein
VARSLSTRGRFAVSYLVLGAVVGVGIGAFLVLLQRDPPPPPPAWSSWMPTAAEADTTTRMLEIANHVGRSYKLPSGNQLVGIQTQSTNAKFQGVVVAKADNATQPDAEYGRDDTAVFLFCGSPKSCKITEGSPTVARGTVLRREALELALYTFEYAHPIDNVLIFFPPDKGETTLTSTLFFRRDDLKSSLKHPLRRTLPQRVPPLPGQIRPAELKTVNELTGDKRYKYLGTSQNVIVIQPPA